MHLMISDASYDVEACYQISINQACYLDSFTFVIRDKDHQALFYFIYFNTNEK